MGLMMRKIADQRTAKFPVTLALHIVLILEHNRCCVDIAPAIGFEGDEVSQSLVVVVVAVVVVCVSHTRWL